MTDRHEVFIYGGGLIGGASAATLCQAGYSVKVITRVPAPQYLGEVVWQFGSIENQREDRDFDGCHAVVYAAGSMTPGSSLPSIAQVLADQVVPVVALAEQAARARVSNFVFISSGGTVYGRTKYIPTSEDVCTAPINAYGMVKVQTEQALLEVARRTSMKVFILRVSNPFGPAQQGTRSVGFVAAAIEATQGQSTLNIWGDGLNRRDFLYLDDVAEAVRLAVESHQGNTILNIGSGRATSLLEVCEIIESYSGRKINIKFDQSREVDVRQSMLDIGKALDLLGWSPKVPLELGIFKTLQYKNLIA